MRTLRMTPGKAGATAALALGVALAPLPAAGQTHPLTVPWFTQEFQPNVKEGGRVNGFAVHHTTDAVVYATSESGGLFRTTNGGATWRHVDALPCHSLGSVAVLPADPNIVLVTTGDDYRAAGGGGVWRSTDGGNTWAQAAIADPFGRRLSGSEIAVAADTGTIYAGTSAGCAVSTDRGASWTLRDPFGGNQGVAAVAALSGGRVLVGGWPGVARSADGGVSWTAARVGPGAVSDMHGLCGSPLRANDAYAVNDATELHRTEDGGDTWVRIASAPAGGGGCGGIGFVRAEPVFILNQIRGVTLYFGNRCGAVQLRCLRNPLTDVVNYSGTWVGLTADHGDPRAIAFHNPPLLGGGDPYLLGTDGGVHSTADRGATWAFTGGGSGGFNALQITEVFGQTVDDAGRHDLYYGTQDNNLYSSGDGGATWGNSQCCEGFFIDSVRRVSRASDSKITFVACSGCGNFVSDPLFANVGGWANVPGAGGNPRALFVRKHVQGVEPGGTFARGLAVTDDLGANWSQFATFPEDRLDLPKVSHANGRFMLRGTAVYQAVRANAPPPGVGDQLVRAFWSPLFGGPAGVRYPAMRGFGGLGINPTMFAWYEVFGVNPSDPSQLIAPDIINDQMMRSQDGGETWAALPDLTKLVTDNGNRRFKNGPFPLVSAVSYCPDNPSLVMVGAAEGGVYVSADGGSTWGRVAGSERATQVSAIHWRTANEAIVSTYGRGLWRLTNHLIVRLPDLEKWCRRPCQVWRFPDPRPDPPPDDRGILVYNGVIQGVRADAGRVREVLVSPGASVVHLIGKDAPVAGVRTFFPGVRVTESAKWVGFGQAGAEPQPPQNGWVVKGLLLDRDDRPRGAVYGDRPADMLLNPPRALPDTRPNKSPFADRPHVRAVTSRSDGGPTASPGELVRLTGERLPAGAEVVAVIDGRPVGEKARVTPNGTFEAAVPVPRTRGFHRVEVRRGDAKGEVIDAVTILVKSADQDRDAQRGRDGPKREKK